jgi:alpha-glucosidase
VWLPSFAQHCALIGDRTAIFYPEGFQAEQTLPSFALLEEPSEIGEITLPWSIYPEFSSAGGRNVATIDIPENTDLYGNGEVIGDLRNNGKEIILWNTDNYGYWKDDGKRLYQSHPWILGVRPNGTSFGILADHTWKQTFFLDDPVRIESEGPPFRIIVIEGDSPQQVVAELALLTGKIDLPPLWALGYHQCRYSYYPASEVEQIAQTFRNKNIPCDVIWMDIDYMDGFRVFTFDPAGFPDPGALNDYLHERGFHAIWMIDPGVKRESGYFIYDQGTAGNHWVKRDNGSTYYGDVWPGSCVFPDFTNPAVREWWAGLYPDFMATGIDGVWNDMNEPAVFNVESGTMPEDNVHRGGGGLPQDIHLRYHNVYGYLMVKATREGILFSNPGKRPFVLTRANHLGGHRYAATWTGDNISSVEHMKMSIPMSLNLGLSAQPFSGPDIGGFIGDPGAGLLAQWMAIGAFYPFSRNHTSTDTGPQEPWAYGNETESVSRIALQRRYKLLPYLYTTFEHTSRTGMPVMQPVFFTDPQDLLLRREQEAFLLGSDLLVVPAWAGCPALPKGKWRPVRMMEGMQEDDGYQALLKQRPGSVIPLAQLAQSTTSYSTDSITLLIALNAEGSACGELYADAGDGFGYRDGEFQRTLISAEPASGDSLQVTCTRTGGDLPSDGRSYRAALVTNHDVFYHAWTTDTVFRIPLEPETFIAVAAPEEGSEFDAFADIPLAIQQEGDLGIESVHYYQGAQLIATADAAPFTASWASVPPGLYTIQAEAIVQGGHRISSGKVRIQVGAFGSGAISHEIWRDIGDSPFLDALTGHPRYPDDPDDRNLLTEFASPIDIDDEYGARIIGYLHPPSTGNYTFWVSGDDYSDLWLSTSEDAGDMQLIAEVPGWSNPQEWEKYPQQRSPEIALEAGEKYFIMARHKENDGRDHLEAAWQTEGRDREIIPGDFLTPYGQVSAAAETEIPLLSIYPNPASDHAIIQAGTEAGLFKVYDPSGKLLLERFIDHGQGWRINTTGWNSGTYLILYSNGNKTYPAKLTIVND